MKAFVATIAKAIRDAGDTVVVKMVYRGQDGERKRRYVSPYRFVNRDCDAFLALCLTSGELRRFDVDRCSDVAEYDANLVEIPMPLETISGNPNNSDGL